MGRVCKVGFLLILIMGMSATAIAAVFTTSSSDVFFSTDDGSMYVKSSGIIGSIASSSIVGSNFHLSAGGTGNSEAAIVLYFNGGLTLGNLQSVSIASSGSPLNIYLWFDKGGDGKFFDFQADGLFWGLNGDTSGFGGASIDASSSLYMLGIAGTYTLAQLQSGAVTGINSTTPIALRIGVTYNRDINGLTPLEADISTVTVNPVPEPSTMLLLGSGLVGLIGYGRRKFKK